MNSQKKNLNLLILGNVDSGKSSLVGHLVYKCGGIDQRTIVEHEKKANERGNAFSKYAWVLDELKAERERGNTKNLALFQIETKNYYLAIIDAPGHKNFAKNIISGASQAEAAILVISGCKGEFEAGISSSGQVYDQATLAFSMGITNLIVAINKMDDQYVNYSQTRYSNIKQEVVKILATIGFKNSQSLNYVPISGQIGDNLTENSTKMPWYTGVCLIDAINTFKPPSPSSKPLRIPIQDVYNIHGVGAIPIGRVESGILNQGMNIVFAPSGQTAEVKAIEMNHESLKKAEPGDCVSFNVNGIAAKDIKKGYVVGEVDNPPTGCDYFIANLVVMNGQIQPGFTSVVDCHTSRVVCKFDQFIVRMNSENYKIEAHNPTNAVAGECIQVKIIPQAPLCVEPFNVYPALGRFVVRDTNIIIALGVIVQVAKSECE
uniref:Elongation factor 1-alpha n=1 Tax=Trepomonas sp. PC1 TaxID=1076344 RepID=A0A146KHU8_9EUKA|eukprot:JAP94971.1 Elongation factor 1-alpha [Trepomonas sp. PC1]